MANEPTKNELNQIFGTEEKDWKEPVSKQDWKTVDTSVSNDTWAPEKGEVLIGVYTGTKIAHTQKYGDRTIFLIERSSDHTVVGVWESAQLKRAFGQISIGTEMRLTYNGKVLPEKGNAYKDYSIAVR